MMPLLSVLTWHVADDFSSKDLMNHKVVFTKMTDGIGTHTAVGILISICVEKLHARKGYPGQRIHHVQNHPSAQLTMHATARS